MKIPVYQPLLSGNEKEYVLDCLESSWISSKGKYVGQFEQAFATYIGSNYASSVSNGTVALHLALVALGIGPGDEVIVPAFTYIASANAILYTGATVVLADSLADTWQIDPDDLNAKITPRTKAIMVVHLYGHACDMDRICNIAHTNNLFLIEDCAEALGTKYKNRHVGTFGQLSTFSFFGNKTITTGEGGMVVTNDPVLYEKCQRYKSQGVSATKEYWHDVIGYNYRMTNICAAIGLAQLEQIETFLNAKRQIALYYAQQLTGFPLITHRESPDVEHSYWMCSILLDDPAERDPLRNHLALHGIETRPVFYPLHELPMYAGSNEQHPVAENLSKRGINLPSWPGLTNENLNFVVNSIRGFFEQKTC